MSCPTGTPHRLAERQGLTRRQWWRVFVYEYERTIGFYRPSPYERKSVMTWYYLGGNITPREAAVAEFRAQYHA
jgi:hypothetical protein